MAGMEANSIDAIVTDPPYGLSFMGKNWDHGIPGVPFWAEALRVAKPGCHLLAFGGTRTFHRLACAIEDAGWEIRDTLMWVYGSGFPKSHNLKGEHEGWGTALKPAYEPIILARKPLDGTVAANVQKWGCGSINIDGCRVGIDKADNIYAKNPHTLGTIGAKGIYGAGKPTMFDTTKGRWPANLLHDGSEEVLELFPESKDGVAVNRNRPLSIPNEVYGKGWKHSGKDEGYGQRGSAARFFYCAKASRAEREAGCEGMAERFLATMGDGIGAREHNESQPTAWAKNHHPTVKPLALMRYLVRLVTPPGGTVLDPFMGSGTTGMAAKQEGFEFIGIEKEKEYVEIAERRMAAMLF